MLDAEPTKLNERAFFLEPLVGRIHSIPGALNCLKIEYVVNGVVGEKATKVGKD